MLSYRNGYLNLLERNSCNDYNEVAKEASPAVQDSYILHKTLVHKLTQFTIIARARIEERISEQSMHQQLANMEDDFQAIASALDRNASKQRWSYLLMIKRSREVMQQAMTCRTGEAIDRLCTSYLQEIRPMIKDYGRTSAKEQLAGLNQILADWVRNKNLSLQYAPCLVVGAKGPRVDMLEMRLLEYIYGKVGVNSAVAKGHLMYVETPVELMANLRNKDLTSIYAKHLLNKKIGLLILGDENAMYKDVLGGFVEELLDDLPMDYLTNSPSPSMT